MDGRVRGVLGLALIAIVIVGVLNFDELVRHVLGLRPYAEARFNTKIELIAEGDGSQPVALGVIREWVMVARPATISTWLLEGEALVIDLPDGSAAFVLPVFGANGGTGRALPVIVEACGSRPPFSYDSSTLQEVFSEWVESIADIQGCAVTSGFPILVHSDDTPGFEWITLDELGQRLGYLNQSLRIEVSLTNQPPTIVYTNRIESLFADMNTYNLRVVNPETGRDYSINKGNFLPRI